MTTSSVDLFTKEEHAIIADRRGPRDRVEALWQGLVKTNGRLTPGAGEMNYEIN